MYFNKANKLIKQTVEVAVNYAIVQRAKILFTLKPKFPKTGQQNERNMKGSSITISFHSGLG